VVELKEAFALESGFSLITEPDKRFPSKTIPGLFQGLPCPADALKFSFPGCEKEKSIVSSVVTSQCNKRETLVRCRTFEAVISGHCSNTSSNFKKGITWVMTRCMRGKHWWQRGLSLKGLHFPYQLLERQEFKSIAR
jgi:hypothetical protein